jgi:peptide/nickel transport system substrate-binding protein
MTWIRLALAAALLAAFPAAVSAAPQGRVVVAQGVDPTTLDPMNHQETPAGNVCRNIFDTLLERDQELKMQPALARELPKLVAPTVWEFKLRPGVKFQNGEPVDAEAVKFSLERLVDPKNKMRGSPPFAPISHVEIVDALTVRVHTKAPWPILDTQMGAGQASIVPPKYYRIELEANEQYWRGAPRVKTLIFRPIPDDAVRVAALQNGEVDVAVNIPPHMANIIANHPKLFLTTAPSVRTIQLMYYTHQYDAQHKLVGPYPGPTADKRVRWAMNYAVDVDDIIKNVLDGKAVRTALMLTDRHFGFDPGLKPVKQDLGKAKQLLAEAGYPTGIEITLNSPQGRYVRDKEVAQAIAGQLSKAGIRTTLRTHEWVHYFGTLAYNHRTPPVWLIGWGTSTYDAETVSTSSWTSTARPGGWSGRRAAMRPSRATTWPSRTRSSRMQRVDFGEAGARIARERGRNSVAECQLPKLDVAGSNPVGRSIREGGLRASAVAPFPLVTEASVHAQARVGVL